MNLLNDNCFEILTISDNDEEKIGLTENSSQVYIPSEPKNVYNYISKLIDSSVYFGIYPVQEMVIELVNQEFTIFVNLVEDLDVSSTYSLPDHITQIRYPIPNNGVPTHLYSYCQLIYKLCDEIEKGKKIYIHCKAGHSRSSMVCISILCALYDYDLKSAIYKVTDAFKKRGTFNHRWKLNKSTVNYTQHMFLMKVHKNIYLNNSGFYKWIFSDEDIENTSTLPIKELQRYFLQKFSTNNFLRIKLQSTYLRKFIFSDTTVYYKYGSILNAVRKKIIETFEKADMM